MKMLAERKPQIDAAIERYLPKKYTNESLERALGKSRYAYNAESVNAAIAEPAWEFMKRGGKRWRPALFLLIVEALGKDPEKYIDYSILVELLHNGTIITDDIEDGSALRRGFPTLHTTHGIDIAMNTANVLYFLPFLTLMKNRDGLDDRTIVHAYEICIQELINIGFGQGMDLAWHKGLANANAVTEKEYLQMCAYKTGTLARLSARLAALLAGANDKQIDAMGQYAEAIGIGFQIQDDVLNLTEGSALSEGKGFGEDVTEGKRSLPVVHTLAVASAADKKRLVELLEMHSKDPSVIMESVGIMENYKALEYSKETARRLMKEGWDALDKNLPASTAKEKLRAFANFLIERDI